MTVLLHRLQLMCTLGHISQFAFLANVQISPRRVKNGGLFTQCVGRKQSEHAVLNFALLN